jgi:AICAR transformylase/IMP cyclohydrolase PurH
MLVQELRVPNLPATVSLYKNAVEQNLFFIFLMSRIQKQVPPKKDFTATHAIIYTQPNRVASIIACHEAMIGVCPGQQSRIHCRTPHERKS